MTNKRFVTTGEISKICEVSAKTVIAWIEKKQLKSFRIGTGPRKVAVSDLFSFLTEKGFPVSSEQEIISILKETRPGSPTLTTL